MEDAQGPSQHAPTDFFFPFPNLVRFSLQGEFGPLPCLMLLTVHTQPSDLGLEVLVPRLDELAGGVADSSFALR